MWGTEPELLVILDLSDDPGSAAPAEETCEGEAGPGPVSGRPGGPGGRGDADPAVGGFGQVTSTFPPRLVLLAAPTSRAQEVAALPGVRAVCVDAVPADLRAALSPAESLFVDGWLARHAEKSRGPSDGRPWDAPGHTPPDAPNPTG
ncbi:hypothetical protein MXD59_09605 [Frankia sp. Ag45/Mut15]|uniref:Uncharacterized protein n=1 Tax=Frankia umida TaxID=573489 RepID=A0ABT0JXT3_9ACTN|nr:hypothetical protein [Frankia umida]MCK9876027.1 hypothetical protein [Frankia umida]